MRRRPSASRAARCIAGSNGMASKSAARHERRVFWLALLGGFPAVALALGLLWFGDFTPRTQWTLTLVVAGVWLACAAVVREQVVRPLQTVSNVLAALRERDYTLRARGAAREPRRRRPARPRARAAAGPRRFEPRSRQLPRGRYAARRYADLSG